MRYFTPTTLLLLLIAFAQPSTAAGEIHTTQFQQWFWQYRYLWPEILHDNCSAQYEVYLSGHRNRSNIDWRGGGGTNSAITQPVIKCMLDNCSEYVKSIMTSAQVMLGITPTILAVLGASHEELAVLTVVGHRPVLALLIGLGSPSVYLSRAFNHVPPAKILKIKDGRRSQKPRSQSLTWKWAIAIGEYAVALGAVANVAVVSYELGVKSVSSIMSNSVFPTMIWTLLVVPIHILGGLSMRLRVRRQYTESNHGDAPASNENKGMGPASNEDKGMGPLGWFKQFPSRLRELSFTEMTPAIAQQTFELEYFKERRLYIFLSWFLSTGIIMHIIFGTFLMSSFLFMGPNDAMGVAAVRSADTPTWALSNDLVPDFVTLHAPLVWLHSDDPFRPSDLLEHVKHTTPKLDQRPIPGLPQLDLDNLAILNDIEARQRWQNVALSSKDELDVTAMTTWLYGSAPDESWRIHNATTCVVVLVEKTPRDLDAFFFYFYSYNQGPNITQVREPLHSLINYSEKYKQELGGFHYGNHVGDWEHNMVRFRDGQPTGIYFSQHSSGAAYAWDDPKLTIENGRPVVFSAHGTHANYASAGNNVHDAVLIDFCLAGLRWDPIQSAYFYRFTPANYSLTRLTTRGSPLPPNSTNLTSFLYFEGMWGDAELPADDPLQKTVPLFGLKRFIKGPTGPLAKQLVRTGLHPDHEGSKTWVRFFVGILMSVYPCCLRGWRKWVSCTVLVALIVSMVLGVRYSVKRYRTRGYKKLGTDEFADVDVGGQNDIELHPRGASER